MNFNLKDIIFKDDTKIEVVGEKYRPSKFNSIVGFVFSLGILILFIFFCGIQFNITYILILLLILLFVFYYGVNVFSEKGYLINKYKNVIVSSKNDSNLEEDNSIDDTESNSNEDDENEVQ